MVRAHQARVGIDIGEHHLGTGEPDRVGGGEEGDRGHDRRIARTEPDAHRREVECRRAAGTDHRAGRIHGIGKRALEGCDGGAGRQVRATQHRLDRGDVVVVDAVPAIGQEGRHAVSINRRISSGPEPVLIGVARVAESLGHRLCAGARVRPVREAEGGLDYVAVAERHGRAAVILGDQHLVQLLAGADADDPVLQIGCKA